MEALHQKHMQSMNSEMQSQMQTMMQKMDKDRAMLKDQVSALETDVQDEKPDSAQIRTHANALIRHLGMMSNMHCRGKAGKKKDGGHEGHEDVALHKYPVSCGLENPPLTDFRSQQPFLRLLVLRHAFGLTAESVQE